MSNVLLVKLAAIGDVTMTCQSLSRHAHRIRSSGLRLHWLIDQNLEQLAQSLCKPLGLDVWFHPVNATRLFQGGMSGKLDISFQMYKIASQCQPDAVVLLHHDRRYRLVLSAATPAPVFMLERGQGLELEKQEQTLTRALNWLGVPTDTSSSKVNLLTSQPGHRLGVLVGGAKNQKTVYREKIWPHTDSFVQLALKESSFKIHLFGGPDDRPQAEEILRTLTPDELERVVDHVGKLRLEDLPTEISKMDGFLGVDSGLVHIAAHVLQGQNKIVVALFGPTNAKVWGPSATSGARIKVLSAQKHCSPCYQDDGVFDTCRYQGSEFAHCMRDLSAAEVLRVFQSIE